MASSIKLFQFIQKFHKIIGIDLYQQLVDHEQYSVNSINIIFLISFAQIICTTIAFLVFEAKSFFAYGFSFFTIICVISSAVIYLIFIWQSQNTSKFIENCERFIEESKYYTTNHKNHINL